MKIQDVISHLEQIAPPQLQENYDNAGFITGNANWDCKGILVALDATESVIQEAVEKKCNVVIAHHPIVFGGLKSLTGKNYVERTVIMAIKNDIAIYAIHTNLDNVIDGVNGKMADMLALVNRQILSPKKGLLKKLMVFVPQEAAETVRTALFDAGGGNIGNYRDCSFTTPGEGTFKAGEGTNPFSGSIGLRHTATEVKLEVVFQSWLESKLVQALLAAHPYEEVAYDIVPIENALLTTGSGLIGELTTAMDAAVLLAHIKKAFGLTVIRHTPLTGQPIKKVAVCGGAGSFLIKTAIKAGAQLYITADVKYHEFFDAEKRLVIADIGHYESEQYTITLLFDILKEKYPTFAVLKTEINTNPVHYFL